MQIFKAGQIQRIFYWKSRFRTRQDNKFEEITCNEYLALLTDHQWEDRENNKIDRLLKQACFRQQASLPDISYAAERNLDKNMFARLGTLDFIARKENIIIAGASGTGKSYLAQALGIRPVFQV